MLRNTMDTPMIVKSSKTKENKTLVVQIPAFNEQDDLPQVLAQIPRSLPGISKIIIQVIDDGSTDDTAGVALNNGADYSSGM